ncbi:hypothetical protein HBI40_160860 [Parastagonospora nodorum]|nr:hypothetical protein HBH46_210640 [Parastagonospora nodorum]KAH5240273.1 hypothetical protein HBI71_219270 [Parastagonospora nodorum]KAH5526962.1 hypothetical protein HBI27_240280 [Parastagonospora nodorum]KAH6025166.1 hypothetical protein HBI54_246560 [Parastagonospora nodorum]KAH6253284.1 hypothetical protein HBI41_183680 [Parastagonospora nodorum]
MGNVNGEVNNDLEEEDDEYLDELQGRAKIKDCERRQAKKCKQHAKSKSRMNPYEEAGECGATKYMPRNCAFLLAEEEAVWPDLATTFDTSSPSCLIEKFQGLVAKGNPGWRRS